MIATAANDTQKPLASTANGSNNNTTNRATLRVRLGVIGRLANSASMTTATMIKARWVGMENPARAA